MCRSWEGAQPDNQTRLADGNIPYHRHYAQFMNGGWPAGQEYFFPYFHKFESSLLWEFDLFWEFSLSLEFGIPRSLLQGLTANWSSGGEKIVLYVVCLTYSLLSLLLLVVVVLVFTLLSY